MLLIFFPLLCKPAEPLRSRLLLAAALCIAAYYYSASTLMLPDKEASIRGKGEVSFSTVAKTRQFSKEIWNYKGTLHSFVDEKTGAVVAKNIPCSATLSLKKGAERPLADHHYLIEGTLTSSQGYYTKLMAPQSNWKPLPQTFSLAEYRRKAKELVSQAIQQNVPEKRVYEFLKGIATGEFNDKEMQFEFSRFGLQHIMAISGFHFAIVAGFFLFFIRLFAPRKIASLILVFLMCSYFLFLGPSPSIMRAWMMILVAIGGCFSERRSNGLNSLGIAVVAILVIDPAMIQNLGFQFSALVTGAILLCYPSFDFFLEGLFAKRPLYEVIDMKMRDQHAYCLVALMRGMLTLSLTVNCLSIPLSLYYFQKFPLMGVVYNWFFPFMVSISIALLIAALMTSWIPPISALLHAINTKYTSYMLDFVYNMPMNFDFYLRSDSLNAAAIIAITSLLFYAAVLVGYFVEEAGQEKREFAFI